ncbi:hypothetical protein PCANC_12813 [Puccinia coronata f. sp. avenae]|uniref:Uncharacterized protein n=1 Tax=Puccinia coronata f. sp. avenae TaxID=200324 RepID=A0A2N5RVY8_9BASI|nr:hypothetical protein PCASD_25424 [Puccinia coronata f. sp. avenae]PLW18913.1 hypothetical protein PCANC_12813 [Puccinia coronata f. sp. avenae]
MVKGKGAAIPHKVREYSKRVFVWTRSKPCREHTNHVELAIIVPLDYVQYSTLYRIADNKRGYYLSRNEMALLKLLGEDNPTFGVKSTWLGKLEYNPEEQGGLNELFERIKKALQTVVESPLGRSDRWCSMAWVFTIIKEEGSRRVFSRGRLGRVKETVKEIL